MPRRIGEVVNYYPRVRAASIRVDEGELHDGDLIRIVGHGHEITEPVRSLELDHRRIHTAYAGETIGVSVEAPVHPRDAVYVLEEPDDAAED